MFERLRTQVLLATRGGVPPSCAERNLSFVLHERSTAPAVRSLARACSRHSKNRALIANPEAPVTVAGDPSQGHDIVLTTRLGIYEALSRCLVLVTESHARPLVLIDDSDDRSVSHPFFRAPAELAVPGEEKFRVMVAALLMRPDQATTHLRIEGYFDWPSERAQAVAAVERLIQAYADQWTPLRPLWKAPAETLLGQEIA